MVEKETPRFFDCESEDCAYNNDGECRFCAVKDRMPKITEKDGCTEGVIEAPCFC